MDIPQDRAKAWLGQSRDIQSEFVASLRLISRIDGVVNLRTIYSRIHISTFDICVHLHVSLVHKGVQFFNVTNRTVAAAQAGANGFEIDHDPSDCDAAGLRMRFEAQLRSSVN